MLLLLLLRLFISSHPGSVEPSAPVSTFQKADTGSPNAFKSFALINALLIRYVTRNHFSPNYCPLCPSTGTVSTFITCVSFSVVLDTSVVWVSLACCLCSTMRLPSASLGFRFQPVLNSLPNSKLGNGCASVLKTTLSSGSTSLGPNNR